MRWLVEHTWRPNVSTCTHSRAVPDRHMLVAECSRHHKSAGQILYDLRRIEYLLGARNPSVREALRQLYCPYCHMPVAVRVAPA